MKNQQTRVINWAHYDKESSQTTTGVLSCCYGYFKDNLDMTILQLFWLSLQREKLEFSKMGNVKPMLNQKSLMGTPWLQRLKLRKYLWHGMMEKSKFFPIDL